MTKTVKREIVKYLTIREAIWSQRGGHPEFVKKALEVEVLDLLNDAKHVKDHVAYMKVVTEDMVRAYVLIAGSKVN